MKKTKKTRILSVLTALVFSLSFMPLMATASTTDTLFDLNFDVEGASTTIINSDVTPGASYAITNTWYNNSDYKKDRLKVQNASSNTIDAGMSYALSNSPFTKMDNALEISGYDSKTNTGSVANTLIFMQGTTGFNSKYASYDAIDCGANGSFRISFDFATTNKNVQLAFITARTLAYVNGALNSDCSQFQKDLFILNANGSMTVFGDTIAASAVGTINTNEWHHVELTFNSLNQSGVKLDGKVIRDMTTINRAASYSGSLRGLANSFYIPINCGTTSDSTASSSKRYLDNIKYDILKNESITSLSDDERAVTVTDAQTILYKSCSELYVNMTKTAAELKNAVTGTMYSEEMRELVLKSDGTVLDDSALLSEASTLQMIDKYGVIQKNFEIIDSYETVSTLTNGAPTAWSTTEGGWTKSDISSTELANCISTSAGINGKNSDDSFMKYRNTSSNSYGYAYLNYWLADDGFTTTAPFTIEHSIFIPTLSSSDAISSLYLNMIGQNKDGGRATDFLFKIMPTNKATSIATVLNHNNSSKTIGLYHGRWNKIAVSVNPDEKSFTLYVNGLAQDAETLSSITAVTRLQFTIEGKSDTCFFGIDDLKVHKGIYNYTQEAIALSDESGKFRIENQILGTGNITLLKPNVDKSNIVSLAETPLSAVLYTDNTYSSEAIAKANGNILVVNDGNGMYGYYAIDVPEIITDYSYSDIDETLRTLNLSFEYNGGSDEKNVTVYIAQYKDGNLASVSKADTTAFGKTYSESFPVIKDADSQTAFIWATGTLKPIVTAINIPVE